MGGSQRGRVLVRDDGRFKACTLGGGRTTWLSASAYVDLDPFPTFAAAFAAVREAVGKESP
jgi:hypothetical protein